MKRALPILVGAFVILTQVSCAVTVRNINPSEGFSFQLQHHPLPEPAKDRDLLPTFSKDLTTFRVLESEVHQKEYTSFKSIESLFLNSDFQKLESILDEKVAHPTIDKLGSYGLKESYKTISDCNKILYQEAAKKLMASGVGALTGPEAFHQLETSYLAKVEQWSRHFPRSTHPKLALAYLYFSQGKAYRGEDSIDKVAPDKLKLYQQSMEKIWKILDPLRKQHLNNPEIYRMLLKASRGIDISNSEREAIFKEGISVLPDYLPLYAEMIALLEPRWFGDSGDVKAFIEWVVSNPRITMKPDILYAKLTQELLQAYHTDAQFREYGLSWSHIKAGYIEMAERNEMTARRLEYFTRMAVIYGDRATAKKLFYILRDTTTGDPGIWYSVDNYNAARDWANRS